MSKTTELVERLRELPRDTRKATVEIYGLCIEASYEIEELVDRCARYAEEIAVLQEKQKWVDAGARQPEYGVSVLAVASGKAENITLCDAVVLATFWDGWELDDYPQAEDDHSALTPPRRGRCLRRALPTRRWPESWACRRSASPTGGGGRG